MSDNRNSYGVKYKVVEADDLNVSHGVDSQTGDVYTNENYPAELQPRDRERAGYRDRVLNMGANLDPTQLMDSDNVNQGAPVIRSDGVVLNGNGRTMAIRRAQATGRADGYRNSILENAERLGLNKDEIAAMKNPVLVREVTGELNGDALTNITQSRQGGMQLSAIEQSREDAKKLSSQVLSQAPEDGDLSKAGARQFPVNAVRAISTPEELNAMTSADGGVTDAGVRRVRNALFAAAFGGDSTTLANLAETSETEGNIVKSITNALTATAGKFARARAEAENGNLPQVDLNPIIQATEKLAALRESGTSVLKHLTQEVLPGMDTESEEVKDLLGFFEGHKRHPQKITTFMHALADGILSQASNSGDLFGGRPKNLSLSKAIANARQQVEGEDITQEHLKHKPTFNTIVERMHKRLQTHKNKGLKKLVNSLLANAKNGDEQSLRTLNRLKGDPTEQVLFGTEEGTQNETSQSTAPAQGTGTQENSNQNAEPQQAQEPPALKQYPKDSKGYKLHRKLKTGAHPYLGAFADSVLSRAANGDTAAQGQVDGWLKSNYSDEQLDSWESFLRPQPQRQATDANPQLETDAAPESESTPESESAPQVETAAEPESEATPETETAAESKPPVEESPNETDGTEEDDDSEEIPDSTPSEENAADDELVDQPESQDEKPKITPLERLKKLYFKNWRTVSEKARNAGEKIIKDFETGKISFFKARAGMSKLGFKDAPPSKPKLSRVGSKGKLENILSDDELTPVQKAIQAFCAKIGVPVKFFRSDSDTQGAYEDGVAYINVNSKATPEWVFHHELGHWLAADNPQLFNRLVKLLDITDEQQQAYRDRIDAQDLTDAEVDAEILCDMMGDEAKLQGLFKDVNKKDASLVERFLSWVKGVLDKFVDFMFKPENGLTRSQRNRLYDSVGKIARSIVDKHGNKKYRYNSRTHALEHADGTPLKALPLTKANEKGGLKYSRSETKKAAVTVTGDEFGQYSDIKELRRKAIDYYKTVLRGTSVRNSILGEVNLTDDVIMFTNRGANKMGSSSAQYEKLLLVKHLPQLIENADRVAAEENLKDKRNASQYSYLHSTAIVNGEVRDVNITIFTDVNGNKYYNHNLNEGGKSTEGLPVHLAQASQEKDGIPIIGKPSDKRISQDAEQDNPRETAAGKFFMKAVDKLKRALHLKGDRIISEEDQRQDLIAKSKEQEKAMEAYDENPTKENLKKLQELGVTPNQLKDFRNAKRLDEDISIRQMIISSPARIAEKIKLFRVFFRMGDRALDKQIQSRGTFIRRYNRVLDIVSNKKDREKLFGLLWKGDQEKKEFGKLDKEEVEAAKANRRDGESETQAIRRAKVEKICKEQDVSENVARAYLGVRDIIRALYHRINEARRHPKIVSRHLSDKDIEELKGNKFVEIRAIGEKPDNAGRRMVTYKEFENCERSFIVTPEQYARLAQDKSIQVIDNSVFEDGQAVVKIREGISALKEEEGYIPHFFHEYSVVIRDKDGKPVSKTLFTAQTEREAVKLAEKWKEANPDGLKEGENLYITPRGLARQLGIDAESLSPVIGDKDFTKVTQKIAKVHGMTLKELREDTRDENKQTMGLHRSLSNLYNRKGETGYVEDMDWILRHYINVTTRYAAMESEFKPQAVSLFEKLFGAFDDDHSGNQLAEYIKDYIRDVNGNPTRIEELMNKTLNKSALYRKFVKASFGNRGWLNAADTTTRFIAYMKLGFYSVSSAVLNLTQLINSGGLLGGYGRLAKHLGKLLAQRGKLTQGQLRILTETGVLNDLGLETSSIYDKHRVSVFGDASILDKVDNALGKTMWLFQTMDTACRAATTLAAYEQARAKGESKDNALKYAAKTNRKANFDYGVTDAPNIFRRTGPLGKVILQFQKYPIKQLELLADMAPWSKTTNKTQKIMFWFPYILTCGLMGFMPLFDWGDKIANKFGFFPKDFLEEVIIKGSRMTFGEKAGTKVSRALLYGIGATANVDLSSRAGLAGFLNNDLAQLVGGALTSTIWNTGENLLSGEYDHAVRSLSPGVYNYLAAFGLEKSTSQRGRTNMRYDDWGSKLVRAFGFRSADESAISDAERIQRHHESEERSEKQAAIDAYIEDSSPETAKRCAELGITSKQIQNEMKKKDLTRWGRFKDNRSKKQRASEDFQSLDDFVDEDD